METNLNRPNYNEPVFDSIVDSCCQNIYISISYNEIKLYVEQQRKEENPRSSSLMTKLIIILNYI